jgi:Lipocalin-like domain
VDEKAAAYNTFIAYYGSFKVDTAAQSVTHHVTASLFPNWVGGDQVRFYQFDEDRLILRATPFPAFGTEVRPYVVWRKVP